MTEHVKVSDGKFGPGTHLTIVPMDDEFRKWRADLALAGVRIAVGTVAFVAIFLAAVFAFVAFDPSPYDSFEIRRTMQ